MDNKATLKISGRDAKSAAKIEGYAIVWGGRDLEGDTFDREQTDLWLDYAPERLPLLWEHGLDDIMGKRVLGFIKRADIRPDDFGVWVQAQLDTSQEYLRAVAELIKRGIVGWSSGSIGHLVERTQAKVITSWPLGEISLTTQPMDPRTISASFSKSLGVLSPELGIMADARNLSEALKHLQERDRLVDEIAAMELLIEIEQIERAIA